MTSADFTHWLPSLIGIVTGPAGAGIVISWWKHRERTRKQTDETALTLVQQQSKRIDDLERWVRELQHQLRGAEAEKLSLFWLLKYCPEDRRDEAVADVERKMRDDADRRSLVPLAEDVAGLRGEVRQAAQVARSARNVAGDEAAAGA